MQETERMAEHTVAVAWLAEEKKLKGAVAVADAVHWARGAEEVKAAAEWRKKKMKKKKKKKKRRRRRRKKKMWLWC